ncbi:MAG: Mov34/MPN/PAD-1 family protein [Sandaracinaceae bacterium]
MSADETPWTRGELTIDAGVLREIEAHAKETYPSECCGFVTGPASDMARLDRAIRADNEADRYHELDPERFPRTSRTYFKINELKAARAFDRQREDGQPIKVIYHSHCAAGAYFSAEDAATFSSRGVLMWPCAFIVVSVQDGEVVDRKLWVHRTGSDEFDESPLWVAS